jgi:DNA-directed RNA polymerase specialized sigma24 family protein
MSWKNVPIAAGVTTVTFATRCPSGFPMGLLSSPTLAIGNRVSIMDDIQLEDLVERAADGDSAAWRTLWEDVEPWLIKLVGNPRFLGRVGQRDDDRNNIILEVMARLHVDHFHRLQLYVATRRSNPNLKFKTWLRVVAKRVGIDYLRGHQNYVDRRRDPNRGSAPGEWIEPGTLPSQSKLPGERPPMTNRGTALELLRYAAGAVPEPQLSALEMWTQSASYDEIARELQIAEGAAGAERLVRAAIERLRRRFRGGPDA